MKKEDILREIRKQDSTVLSFPDRGPWGSSNYRGNCSGYIPGYFIDLYNAKSVAEVFAGSGTTSDICKDLGVSYVGIDLNPNPTREDILTMNILDETEELPDLFYCADMTFLHPPYPGINKVRYSNAMWKDTQNMANMDIQNMDFETGMNAVNKAIIRTYATMKPGAYEVVLVGEIRSRGEYYSMFRNLAIPGKLHQTFIKLQHNTVSDRNRNYAKSDRAFTGQEMIAVIKKPSGYELAYVIPKVNRIDIRDSKMATWKDIVSAAIRNLKGEFHLSDIYKEIEGCDRAKQNKNWQAKIRQTLQKMQSSGLVHNTQRGIWMAC